MERLTHDAPSAAPRFAAHRDVYYRYQPFLGESDRSDEKRQSRRMTPAQRQAAKERARIDRQLESAFWAKQRREGLCSFDGRTITFYSALGRAK